MSKLEEKDILGRLKVWRSCATVYHDEFWTKKDDRVYKRIVEVIKIFYAKEISSGTIKEEISRQVLTEWLEGINQAATAMKDKYVMKATTQLIAMIKEEMKAKRIWDATCPGIAATWLPTAENINALPEPVRNYVAGLETNADPPSMVQDNIIMRDTIKTLELKLEEGKEVTEEWIREKARIISKKGSYDMNGEPHITIEEARDFIRSLVEEIRNEPK